MPYSTNTVSLPDSITSVHLLNFRLPSDSGVQYVEVYHCLTPTPYSPKTSICSKANTLYSIWLPLPVSIGLGRGEWSYWLYLPQTPGWRVMTAYDGHLVWFPRSKGELLFSSAQSLIRVRLFATPWIAARQASLSVTNFRSSLKLCPSSQWCHPAISSSGVPFSSCPKSLAASGSFPMSQLFAQGGQSIGVSASASVLPMNIQDWSPLG